MLVKQQRARGIYAIKCIRRRCEGGTIIDPAERRGEDSIESFVVRPTLLKAERNLQICERRENDLSEIKHYVLDSHEHAEGTIQHLGGKIPSHDTAGGDIVVGRKTQAEE